MVSTPCFFVTITPDQRRPANLEGYPDV